MFTIVEEKAVPVKTKVELCKELCNKVIKWYPEFFGSEDESEGEEL
jgi:hypothetical protein